MLQDFSFNIPVITILVIITIIMVNAVGIVTGYGLDDGGV
jgi:hypothetical protein